MLDAATEALVAFTDPTMLLFLGVGVLVGIIIGVIPGLGGTGAVAVLMPFVFVLEPNQAIAMIIGAVAVVHTSDVITSVVLGIPGSASASVFLLDGHEMAKKGQGGRALSTSFISSMIGGLIGIVVLTLIVPIAAPIVTAFGSPEIFALIVMGIFLTALLSKGNVAKGLLISAFGLALGLIGVSPVSAEYRYTFNSEFLTDGIGLVAAALGIFGLAEIIDLVAKRGAVSKERVALGGGWRQGMKDVGTYKSDVLRGSAVGVGVGMLPGVGTTAGAWLAYGQAQAFAGRRKDSTFGKGDPRGVIAPSAASNGIESGALIPTLLFGVPGAAPFALLLGVLLIFGVQPGPSLITNDLDLVYLIVWAFAIASVIGAALAFFLARPLARLSFVSFPVLAAALIPILFMSGFQEPLHLNVFYLMLALGIVGWICKVTHIPRAPFLIAFVLAEPLERYYFLTVNAFSPDEWMTRPFVIVIAIILTGAIIVPLVRRQRKRTSKVEETMQFSEKSDMAVPPFVELAVSIAALLFFTAAIVMSRDFSENGQLFPLAVGGVGLLLALISLGWDISRVRGEGRLGRFDDVWLQRLKIVGMSIAWILAYIWLVFLVGMLVGSAAFALIFLLVVARMKVVPTIIYAACIVGALYLLAEFAQLVPPAGYLL
ncbi:tripartite tricarboxylate transporter permease [Nesterenkonia sp. HG001]|uniref:tripartite tricarboxylate transporter permease n=1 Tax=Nesterenkonia sp. HG001 TaxID=2983207 RepID=UPI002AC541E4|nr:tripartite tricarboxylate transporter permease [Nesterenkonia sp. HG001]MDZ5079065.1 tripartite tricarboxylate transporter permease [Nesterenkonia sp. HG001]